MVGSRVTPVHCDFTLKANKAMSYPRISTRRQRSRWYHQVHICGKPVKEVCSIFGISRRCYYRWHQKDFGPVPSCHSPKRQPNLKLTAEVKQFIETEKQKTNYGPLKMKYRVKQVFKLDLSTTLIYRYYRKRGLIRKPQKRLSWYEPIKEHVLVRKPGEGVQLDVKYVYEKGSRKYQFSVFDPLTCQYFFRVFSSRHSRNAISAFREAEIYWNLKILSVQTDNGSEFRGSFHDWLTLKNIPHYFIPKSSPYWNAQVERVHKTIDDEFYQNPYRIWRTAHDWLWYYNRERIHLTLKGLTPHEAYLKSVTLDC